MKIMIQRMYEIDKAMSEKMNTIKIDRFPLVNRSVPNKVRLKEKLIDHGNIFSSTYSMQDREQFDRFVIDEIVWNRVL